MTDKRLLCVASLVREGAKLADIGTDHAYLPVHLMQNNRIQTAIAADIGEGPAASARLHIAQAGLSSHIDVRVCDGLCGIAPDEVTDIVIAGMGGETIIHILSEAPWTASPSVRLVLQPMTKTVELRAWLFEHGFVLDEEHIVQDGRHIYCVMAAHFDGHTQAIDPLMTYIGALDRDEGKLYFEQQCTYLQNKLRGLRCADKADEAKDMEQLLTRFKAYMTEG